MSLKVKYVKHIFSALIPMKIAALSFYFLKQAKFYRYQIGRQLKINVDVAVFG